MGSPPWPRQLRVLLARNRRLLSRRPVHLAVLLSSSVVSVVLAWLAGRDARGPPGEFPPLTDCGLVDPAYVAEQRALQQNVAQGDDDAGDYYYSYDRYASASEDIPATLNAPWRGALPLWLMGLGPTAAGVSAFLIARDELQSRRWGTLKAADPSAIWASWLLSFAALGAANSLAGAVAAAAVPRIHAFESVGFGLVFATLWLSNVAQVAAGLFLAALCGTCASAALSVFLVVGTILAAAAPAIGASASRSYTYLFNSEVVELASNTYSHPENTAGAFWHYGSTARYDGGNPYGPYGPGYDYSGGVYYYDGIDPDAGQEDAGRDAGELRAVQDGDFDPTPTQCQLPLVSYDQSRDFKTPAEQDEVPKEDIFLGCYVVASASSVRTGASSFFWYLLPQTHFLAAWSNILGYTALPGNEFSLAQASQSPEILALQSLRNHKGIAPEAPLYDPDNTEGTSLFPQGSTIVAEQHYDYNYQNYYYDSFSEPESNCPSSNVIENLCRKGETNCYNPKVGTPTTGGPSVNDDLGYLASLVAIYTLLAAYVAAVLPMGNGAALKPWFPFLWRFWCPKRGGADGDGEGGVQAVNVSKSYGRVEALKPFSLTMKPGEVTAILGHNGAGKSTFVNLLCCAQNPSGGDILVCGRSVSGETQVISKMIGECKQDDFLWPNLTAREHLELFGGIRGVREEDMADTVQRWLESVDLETVQHMRVSSFSGGMKRRLSVALSTIGDAPIVVLDEPTTGMDPVSRRFVWKHISGIKAGRVILLTTHAMEEADLLSDHVAIMTHGTLAAFGSPLELKTKHGSALQFTLISEKEDVGAVEDAVKNAFADSLSHIKFDASDSGYSTLTIKSVFNESERTKQETKKIASLPTDPEIVTVMPIAPALAVPVLGNGSAAGPPEVSALPVDSNTLPGGVPVTTLIAFIGWLEREDSPIEEFGISNASLEEVFLAVTRHAGPEIQHQLQGATGCCSCCCCCRRRRVPQTTSEAQNDVQSANSVRRSSQNLNQSPEVHISSYTRRLSVAKQTLALIRFSLARSWTGRPSIANWITFGLLFCVGNMLVGFGMAVLWPGGAAWYFLLIPVCLLSFMLISIISPIYSDRNNGLLKMLSTQNMLELSFLLGTSIYSWIVQFAYSFILLTLFYCSTIFRTATRMGPSDCDDRYAYDCGYAKFGNKPVVSPWGQKQVLAGTNDGVEVSVYAHFASGGYEMILGIIFAFSLTAPGAVLSTAFLPGFKLTLVGISLGLLAAVASPGILHVTNYLDPYFFGNCTEQILGVVNCTESTFTLDSANGDFVECVGFAELVERGPIYCTPAHAGILPQMGLFQTLALTLLSDIVFYSEPEAYVEEFTAKLVEGGASCSGSRCKFAYARQLYGENIGFMIVGAILLMILGVGMATVLMYPKSWMVRARRAIGASFKCCVKKQRGSNESEEIKEMTEVNDEREAVHAIMRPFLLTPEDVEANNTPTPTLEFTPRTENRDQLPPVVMHKLRKVFPPLGGAPEKVALKSLDLHVPNGQVLGLLGKNGAGKTTALKILAGMHDATSGIGLISGYDVHTELNSVYERLGNCPQFDCVWRDQSVQRHLEFYARLKGIENPAQAASDIANAVGLGAPEVYNRPSGNLSGGMRRRLSIAVSLIGSPNTLLLDEPTTGLDPSTRNEIWSLVSSFATPERAIIITTHMMLEADALCSRIAIVAKGSLKVVGTQQHLKDNYGSGYLLQLNLSHDSEESVNSLLQFVKSNIHEDAKIVTKQAKTIHINLPRDVNIQKIFTTLYSDHATDAMINQFLVSQSSLEDVFLALGE